MRITALFVEIIPALLRMIHRLRESRNRNDKNSAKKSEGVLHILSRIHALAARSDPYSELAEEFGADRSLWSRLVDEKRAATRGSGGCPSEVCSALGAGRLDQFVVRSETSRDHRKRWMPGSKSQLENDGRTYD